MTPYVPPQKEFRGHIATAAAHCWNDMPGFPLQKNGFVLTTGI